MTFYEKLPMELNCLFRKLDLGFFQNVGKSQDDCDHFKNGLYQ